MNVLCLGHRKQQGKDTAARNLAVELQMRYPQMRILVNSLANPLYKICRILDPEFQTKSFYDKRGELKEVKMSSGYTPRELLINVGQGIKKSTDSNIWVRSVLNVDCDFLIIPDLRYLEEAIALPGKKVRITRSEVTSDEADDNLLDYNWDHEILNNGTIRDMSRQLLDYVLREYTL